MPKLTPEKQLEKYEPSPSAKTFVENAGNTGFSLLPVLALFSGGLAPKTPANEFGRLFSGFFSFNTMMGRSVLGPALLGAREEQANNIAAKLSISREDALKLMIDQGQTVVASMQTIQTYAQDIEGKKNTLTAPYIMEKLGCSEEQALMMLAEKQQEKTWTGAVVGFISKANLPHIASAELMGFLLDVYAAQAFTADTQEEPDYHDETQTTAQWMLLVIVANWALKSVVERLTNWADNQRLQDFFGALRNAHTAELGPLKDAQPAQSTAATTVGNLYHGSGDGQGVEGAFLGNNEAPMSPLERTLSSTSLSLHANGELNAASLTTGLLPKPTATTAIAYRRNY